VRNDAVLENRDTSGYSNPEQKIKDLPHEGSFSQSRMSQKLQKLEGRWEQGSSLGRLRWAQLFSSLPVQHPVLCLPFLENR